MSLEVLLRYSGCFSEPRAGVTCATPSSPRFVFVSFEFKDMFGCGGFGRMGGMKPGLTNAVAQKAGSSARLSLYAVHLTLRTQLEYLRSNSRSELDRVLFNLQSDQSRGFGLTNRGQCCFLIIVTSFVETFCIPCARIILRFSQCIQVFSSLRYP